MLPSIVILIGPWRACLFGETNVTDGMLGGKFVVNFLVSYCKRIPVPLGLLPVGPPDVGLVHHMIPEAKSAGNYSSSSVY